MFKHYSYFHRGFITFAAYLLVIAGALSISTLRLRAQSGAVETATSESATTATYKPYFSLSTNRTYGTVDRARVWQQLLPGEGADPQGEIAFDRFEIGVRQPERVVHRPWKRGSRFSIQAW